MTVSLTLGVTFALSLDLDHENDSDAQLMRKLFVTCVSVMLALHFELEESSRFNILCLMVW